MRIGYRVVSPGEVGRWDGEIVQISLYRGQEANMARLMDISRVCAERGMPYVLHPVGYSLLALEELSELRRMAGVVAGRGGEALLLHDERSPGGGRLTGPEGERFRAALEELGAAAPVSIENSSHTGDVRWFWDNFARSVTLDMGHMESAGLDSVEFVRSLDEATVRKVRYVHMHGNGELRGGLTDHHPLRPGCRELKALREFLLRKAGVGVILEINEREETGGSLALLRSLRDELLTG